MMTFDRDKMREACARLAQQGVALGTSSWKYPGWFGQLYDRSRYVWRGRYSESRFARLCLAEYAEVFRTVCVDAAYYKFPDRQSIASLVSEVPSHFRFGFKVTDAITVKRFPQLPRFGARGGETNPDFLNVDRFIAGFLKPCEEFRDQIGLLIFEFSRFDQEEFGRGREFVAELDRFLSALPAGWPYGVEIRNRTFLHPEYFATLSKHGVAHIFNSWTGMPSLAEQMALPGSRTAPGLAGARLLLKPGRKYEQAVAQFSPYSEIRDPYPEGRAAASRLIRELVTKDGTVKTFIYVNNRFEGNALQTLAAILDESAD